MTSQLLDVLANSTCNELLQQLDDPRPGSSSMPPMKSMSALLVLLKRLREVIDDNFTGKQQQRLFLLESLLKLIPSTVPSKAAAQILRNESGLASTLEAAFKACAGYCQAGLPSEPALPGRIMVFMLQALQDIACWRHSGAEGAQPVLGRDICGPALIPPIMSFVNNLLLHEDNAAKIGMPDSIGVAREALNTLATLVTNCRANAAALLGLHAACNSLFGACLGPCGDFAMQVDMLDLLYRCGKQHTLPESYLSAFSPKDSAERLEAGLAGHVQALNKHAAESTSVLSIEAHVSSRALPPHADTYVHFGKRSICMRVFKPGTDGDKWHISIPYTMVRMARCRPGPHLRLVLAMHLGELHGTLKTMCEDISQFGPSDKVIDITFAEDKALAICSIVPEPMAHSIKAMLPEEISKTLQDSLPQDTPQKLPGPAAKRGPKTSVAVSARPNIGYPPLQLAPPDHRSAGAGGGRMQQLQLAKTPAPLQAAGGAQQEQPTPAPAGTPPGAPLLAGHVALEEAAEDRAASTDAPHEQAQPLPDSYWDVQCAQRPPGDTEDQKGAPLPMDDAFGEPPKHLSAPDESNDLFLARSGGTTAAKSPSPLSYHQQQQQPKAPTPISQRCPTPGIEGSPHGPGMQQPRQQPQQVPNSLPKILEEEVIRKCDDVLQMVQRWEQHASAAAGTERRSAGNTAHARAQQDKPLAARELLYSQGQGGKPMQPDQAAGDPGTSDPAWRARKPRSRASRAAGKQAPHAEPEQAADPNAICEQDRAAAAPNAARNRKAAEEQAQVAVSAAATRAAAKPNGASVPPMQTFAGRKTPQKAARQEAPALQQEQALAEPPLLAAAAHALPNWLQVRQDDGPADSGLSSSSSSDRSDGFTQALQAADPLQAPKQQRQAPSLEQQLFGDTAAGVQHGATDAELAPQKEPAAALQPKKAAVNGQQELPAGALQPKRPAQAPRQKKPPAPAAQRGRTAPAQQKRPAGKRTLAEAPKQPADAERMPAPQTHKHSKQAGTAAAGEGGKAAGEGAADTVREAAEKVARKENDAPPAQRQPAQKRMAKAVAAPEEGGGEEYHFADAEAADRPASKRRNRGAAAVDERPGENPDTVKQAEDQPAPKRRATAQAAAAAAEPQQENMTAAAGRAGRHAHANRVVPQQQAAADPMAQHQKYCAKPAAGKRPPPAKAVAPALEPQEHNRLKAAQGKRTQGKNQPAAMPHAAAAKAGRQKAAADQAKAAAAEPLEPDQAGGTDSDQEDIVVDVDAGDTEPPERQAPLLQLPQALLAPVQEDEEEHADAGCEDEAADFQEQGAADPDSEEEGDFSPTKEAGEQLLMTPVPDLAQLFRSAKKADAGAAGLQQMAQATLQGFRDDIDTALGKGPAKKHVPKRPKLATPQDNMQDAEDDDATLFPTPRAPAKGSRAKAAVPGLATRKKHAAAAAAGDDNAEEDENGPSLNALVQQLTAAAATSSAVQDADSEEEEDMAEVQQLMKRVMAHKKAAARKKEAAIIQAAQEQIGALMKGAQAAIHKDARAVEAALAQGAKAHADALGKHEEALRQLHAAYEAAVAAEWGRMQTSGKRQAAFIKEQQAAAAKRATAHKRKLAEVERSAAEIATKAEAQVKATRRKAGRMTGLARALQPFVAGQASCTP